MNISRILSAFGKPPAHPQALAVSKLCRFLNEHSCLPYALDCMGKPDPHPYPELIGRILELLPIKQPYKRKQQTNFLGMQEAWTPISIVRCLFRDFTNQYKCTNLANGAAEAVYTLSTMSGRRCWLNLYLQMPKADSEIRPLQCEAPVTMPKQDQGQAACSVPISLHLLQPVQLSTAICRYRI